MPHHSKQNQQQRKTLDGPMTSSPRGYCKTQQSFHNSPSSDSEVSKRNQAANSWMTQSVEPAENQQQCYYQGQYHRVPSSPPDVVGSACLLPDVGSQECISKYIQNKRDPSQEIASVLLMAAAAATSVKETSTSVNQNDGRSLDIEVVDSQGSRPLKKRKSTDQNVSETGTNSGDTCHVSPISHSSKSGATDGTNTMSHDTPSTSSAHSFDMKDSTTAGSIATSTSQSQPQNSMFQMIPQFPSLLHWILSEPSTQISSSKFAVDFSVLQWVSHGQAWRIIRWDAFHREVLPALFPQFISNATDTGSIDAFMWQLKAWGFQEIRDGPDIGAFAHSLFRRGHPKMCEEMKFEPTDRTTSSSVAMDTRSILRVPSLNSSASASTSTTRPNNLPEERSSVSSIGILDYTGSPLRQHPANKFLAGHQLGPPAYVNYRPEEMNLTQDGWQLSSKYNSQGVWPGIHGMMPSRKVIEIGHQTVSPYSPIRIRSSRGAPRRHSLSSSVNSSPSVISSPMDDSSTTTSSSRGFPISNRGMGRRKIVVSTSTTSTVKGHSSDNTNDEVVMLKNLTATNLPTSDDSQDKSIEGKFPRSALKRKLPLMAPVPTADGATTTSA